jgi:hypothetical protein
VSNAIFLAEDGRAARAQLLADGFDGGLQQAAAAAAVVRDTVPSTSIVYHHQALLLR